MAEIRRAVRQEGFARLDAWPVPGDRRVRRRGDGRALAARSGEARDFFLADISW